MVDREAFVTLLDSTKVKELFAPYNREYMRLNMYITYSMDKDIRKQVELISNMPITTQQKLAVYQLVFQYYVSSNNEKEARLIKKQIEELVDAKKLDIEIKTELEMEISIVFKKDINAISYIDGKLKDCSIPDKVAWNVKKARIYKANNRLDDAMQCIQLVLDYTEDLDEKEIIQNLLNNNLNELN